jgi:hypothetical protein
MLIDDIARLVPLVFDNRRVTVEAFSGPKNVALLPQRRQFPEIEPLLKLDDEHSWWHMAFKRGEGVRQRIIHFPDLVTFQGERPQGDERVAMVAYLYSPEGRTNIDFLDSLRCILAGFCNWLDGFEEALIEKVQSRSQREGFSWSQDAYREPLGSCFRVHLPVDKPFHLPRDIPDRDFLYLPVCEGSSSIKCTVQVRLGGPSREDGIGHSDSSTMSA